jgi:hypothetical protein
MSTLYSGNVNTNVYLFSTEPFNHELYSNFGITFRPLNNSMNGANMFDHINGYFTRSRLASMAWLRQPTQR